MTKLRLSQIIDSIFVFGFCFLIVFCWIRFYTKNTILSAFVGLIITTIFSLVLAKILNAKSKRKNITKKDKQDAQFCALQFGFMPLKQCLMFFCDILKQKNKVAFFKSHLVLNPQTQNATLFVPLFYKSEILETDIQNCFILAREKNCNTILICAKSFSQAATTLAKNLSAFHFSLFDTFETYSKIIKPNPLPPKIVDTSVEKLHFSQLVLSAFDKKRIRNYLLFGVILLVSSFFVYYKIYYLISGSILIVLCIVILFLPNKKSNVPKT